MKKTELYPSKLNPTAVKTFNIPVGSILIPKVEITLHRWEKESPGENYGGKAILDYLGRPGFAELVVLWMFIDTGWDGVWVDSYRRCYRRGFWNSVPFHCLPDFSAAEMRKIVGNDSFPRGCWDLLIWRDGKLWFIELKRKGRARIRETQIKWLERALASGVQNDDFLLLSG